jgi:hypothetical protein
VFAKQKRVAWAESGYGITSLLAVPGGMSQTKELWLGQRLFNITEKNMHAALGMIVPACQFLTAAS